MNLELARDLALEKMAQHGISDWSFRFDNSKKRFGCCSYRKREISLSRELVLLNDKDRVLNTILHEIAHALTKGEGHNRVWKQKAIEIGCDGKRCYSIEDVVQPLTKYTATCPSCGYEQGYQRKMKRKKACGKCCKKYNGGRYSNEFSFVITQNY